MRVWGCRLAWRLSLLLLGGRAMRLSQWALGGLMARLVAQVVVLVRADCSGW